jgi:hypothetical protein
MGDQLLPEAATYITQEAGEAIIHAVAGIRTRDPSNNAFADLDFRHPVHRNWLIILYFTTGFFQLCSQL